MFSVIAKQPSPDTNPAIHCPTLINTEPPEDLAFVRIYVLLAKYLKYGTILGKAVFSSSVKPRLREALRDTIFCIPFIVKCSLELIIPTADLKRRKYPSFWIIKGYLIKWGIITIKSSIEDT